MSINFGGNRSTSGAFVPFFFQETLEYADLDFYSMESQQNLMCKILIIKNDADMNYVEIT